MSGLKINKNRIKYNTNKNQQQCRLEITELITATLKLLIVWAGKFKAVKLPDQTNMRLDSNIDLKMSNYTVI